MHFNYFKHTAYLKNGTIIYDNNYNMSLFSDDLNNKSVIE